MAGGKPGRGRVSHFLQFVRHFFLQVGLGPPGKRKGRLEWLTDSDRFLVVQTESSNQKLFRGA